MDNIIISEDQCNKINFDKGGIYYHLKSNIYCLKDDKKIYPIRVCKKCNEYFDFKKGKKICNECL